MQNIDVNQAKQQLPQLIEQAVGGNEVIITKGGQPVVRLVVYEKTENAVTPITIHATTRQQINFRLKTGRFIYE